MISCEWALYSHSEHTERLNRSRISSAGSTGEETSQYHNNGNKFIALDWGNGALGRIRTPDPLIRSQVLYPAELPAREPAV